MRYGLSLLAALSLFTLPAHAGDVIPGEFSGTVGFTTDYAFRGVSQSDEELAVQGSFDYSHDSGLYLGAWGSSVDFTDADLEVDLYGGYTGELGGGLTFDVGGIYYYYPGARDSLNYDFFEVALALGYDFEAAAVSAAVNYSPEYFGDSGDAVYYAGYVDVPLPYDFTLSGHVGYQTIDDNAAFGLEDYVDYSVGVGYSFEGFDLALQFVDTDLDEPGECADGCEERVIFSISRSFP